MSGRGHGWPPCIECGKPREAHHGRQRWCTVDGLERGRGHYYGPTPAGETPGRALRPAATASPDREDRVTVLSCCASCGWTLQDLVPVAATLELVAGEIRERHRQASPTCPAVLRRCVSLGLSTEGLTVARGVRPLP